VKVLKPSEGGKRGRLASQELRIGEDPPLVLRKEGKGKRSISCSITMCAGEWFGNKEGLRKPV